MRFRDLVEDMDAQLLDGLGDTALINNRQIDGFFSAPWLQARIGRVTTSIREPHFDIRVIDSSGLEAGQIVLIDLPDQDGGGSYDLVKFEPDGTGWVSLILRKRVKP